MSIAAAGASSLRSGAIILDKSTVLRLYKDLLRYSGRLQFTDKSYYLERVRAEFRRHQTLSKAEDIHFYYNKGVAFLTRQRLV